MKRIFTFLIAGLFGIQFSNAQCSVTVPMDAEVVSSTTFVQKTRSNTSQWVCRDQGNIFRISGNNNSIYVERGDTITVSGDSNSIYMKENCQLNLDGDMNTVYRDGSSSVVDQGNMNTNNNCSPASMIFTYTDTVSGCDIWAGIKPTELKNEVRIYPNPVQQELFIMLPEVVREVVHVSVMDINGRVLLQQTFDGIDQPVNLNTSELNPGMYFLNVWSKEFRYLEKIQVD